MTTEDLYHHYNRVLNALDENERLKYIEFVRDFLLGYSLQQFNVGAANILKTQEQRQLHEVFIHKVLANGLSPCSSRNREFVLMQNPPFLNSATSRGLVCRRFLYIAWHSGIRSVDEGITDIVIKAMEVFIKKIVTSVIVGNNGFKIVYGTFPHQLGQMVPNPWVKNYCQLNQSNTGYLNSCPLLDSNESGKDVPVWHLKATDDEINSKKMFMAACSGNEHQEMQKITMRHLCSTIQTNQNLIKNSVMLQSYIERILMNIND